MHGVHDIRLGCSETTFVLPSRVLAAPGRGGVIAAGDPSVTNLLLIYFYFLHRTVFFFSLQLVLIVIHSNCSAAAAPTGPLLGPALSGTAGAHSG